MLRDHRPLFLKRFDRKFQRWYANRFLRPNFERLGLDCVFMKPWHVEVFGGPVVIGDRATILATSDKKIRLTVWSAFAKQGKIEIGDYCLICPGVRISAATEIVIGDSCMLAQGVFVTDSDWHGVYDRSQPIGATIPVHIGNNVWIGDSAIVCKGVRIGENSIIGAGSVVVRDVPANVVSAGNPATVVKYLDSEKKIKTRAHWMADPQTLAGQFAEIDRHFMKNNTFLGWLRWLIHPQKGD